MKYNLTISGRTVRNIDVYKSTLDMLDAVDPGNLHQLIKDMLTDDECRSVLQCADDYETFNYLVINNDVVVLCDSLNGEVHDQEDLYLFSIRAAKYVLDQLGWPEDKMGDTDPIIF
jgi:glutaredoxin-related protein